MGRKAKVRDYDQFIVRLPPGMRERIKAKAERAGMSMNEAIVYCLMDYFPAPATLEDRINYLAVSVAALKHGNDLEQQIDAITEEIDKTLHEVAGGKIAASKSFRDKVKTVIQQWEEEAHEIAKDRPFDDENYSTPTTPDDPDDLPF